MGQTWGGENWLKNLEYSLEITLKIHHAVVNGGDRADVGGMH